MDKLPLGADDETVIATVHRQPYTGYRVYDGDIDQLIGVVNVKDLLVLKARGGRMGWGLANVNVVMDAGGSTAAGAWPSPASSTPTCTAASIRRWRKTR